MFAGIGQTELVVCFRGLGRFHFSSHAVQDNDGISVFFCIVCQGEPRLHNRRVSARDAWLLCLAGHQTCKLYATHCRLDFKGLFKLHEVFGYSFYIRQNLASFASSLEAV